MLANTRLSLNHNTLQLLPGAHQEDQEEGAHHGGQIGQGVEDGEQGQSLG